MNKEELAFLLAHRITNKLRTLFNDPPAEEDLKDIHRLSEWLIESGMVTEATMFPTEGDANG